MVTNKMASSNITESTGDKTNPALLGREFVRQYYTMLNEGPQNLFRYARHKQHYWIIELIN